MKNLSRLLIIGGSGLLGFKCIEEAAKDFDVFATYNARGMESEHCEFWRLDKTNRDEVLSHTERIEPDVVIDTAALHNVNQCETHRGEAHRVNVEGTRNVAEACRKIGAKMIFLSTDYVFDGKKGHYTEDDAPNPLSYYAVTKLEGERAVAAAGTDYAVARSSVIYGWNPSELKGLKSSSGKSMNFVIWALGKLQNGEEISIVTNQYSSPTLADNLAEALLALARTDKNGIYHTAGKGCINRFDFTKKIAEIFEFDVRLIKPVTSDMFKQVAERPLRCCLDVSKAETDLKIKFLTPEEGLKKMKKQRETGK
jgi:dTDP-4-dehydrorhamnose reductase